MRVRVRENRECSGVTRPTWEACGVTRKRKRNNMRNTLSHAHETNVRHLLSYTQVCTLNIMLTFENAQHALRVCSAAQRVGAAGQALGAWCCHLDYFPRLRLQVCAMTPSICT